LFDFGFMQTFVSFLILCWYHLVLLELLDYFIEF